MRNAIKPFKVIERPIRVYASGVTPQIQVSPRTHIKTVGGWIKRSEWMRRAANLLVKRWTVGQLTNFESGKKERICMLGALAIVKTGDARDGILFTYHENYKAWWVARSQVLMTP